MKELILGYISKHGALRQKKKYLFIDVDLCENFPDSKGHPRNLGIFLTPLEPVDCHVEI